MKAREINGQIEFTLTRAEMPMLRQALNAQNGTSGHAKDVREDKENELDGEGWFYVPDNFLETIADLNAKERQAREVREARETALIESREVAFKDAIQAISDAGNAMREMVTAFNSACQARDVQESATAEATAANLNGLVAAVMKLADRPLMLDITPIAQALIHVADVAGRPVEVRMPECGPVTRETETTLRFDGDGNIVGKKERTTETPGK